MMRFSTLSPRVSRPLLAALLPLWLAACMPTAGESDWVATVNGREISREALEDAVEPVAGDATGEAREEIVLRELETLIREQVVLCRAEELDIEVADTEVDGFLDRLLGQGRGPVDSAFREEVRRQMIIDRTTVLELASELEVPESAVAVHFAEHPERYATPPRAQARHIVVEDEEKAEWILTQIRSGTPFEELARAHSLGPEARDGGLLPAFARGELPEAFDRAFDLRPGQISEVVESPYGYHIFRLEEPVPELEPSLEEAGEQIRAELRQTRFAGLRDSWLRELRRKARIRINEEALESLR